MISRFFCLCVLLSYASALASVKNENVTEAEQNAGKGNIESRTEKTSLNQMQTSLDIHEEIGDDEEIHNRKGRSYKSSNNYRSSSGGFSSNRDYRFNSNQNPGTFGGGSLNNHNNYGTSNFGPTHHYSQQPSGHNTYSGFGQSPHTNGVYTSPVQPSQVTANRLPHNPPGQPQYPPVSNIPPSNTQNRPYIPSYAPNGYPHNPPGQSQYAPVSYIPPSNTQNRPSEPSYPRNGYLVQSPEQATHYQNINNLPGKLPSTNGYLTSPVHSSQSSGQFPSNGRYTPQYPENVHLPKSNGQIHPNPPHSGSEPHLNQPSATIPVKEPGFFKELAKEVFRQAVLSTVDDLSRIPGEEIRSYLAQRINERENPCIENAMKNCQDSLIPDDVNAYPQCLETYRLNNC